VLNFVGKRDLFPAIGQGEAGAGGRIWSGAGQGVDGIKRQKGFEAGEWEQFHQVVGYLIADQ
jgi:hypothetical protein